MPPRSSSGRGGQSARSQAAAATGAGPSTSGRDAVPPAVLAALCALANAAPSLVRLPGPYGAPPAPLSLSTLRRLLSQICSGSAELSKGEDGGVVAAATLLLPQTPVTLALLLSQPPKDVPDDGSERLQLEAQACNSGRMVTVQILVMASLEVGDSTPPYTSARLRAILLCLLRAGVLSFAARNMAQAAATVEATPPGAALPSMFVVEFSVGTRLAYVAALAARTWPELAPEVEAALEDSQLLQHAGRLFVLLLAAMGPRLGIGGAVEEGVQLHMLEAMDGSKILTQSCATLLSGHGATPRAAAAVRGWPLHALLVFAVGQLSAGEPPTPTYGLPAELLAAGAALRAERGLAGAQAELSKALQCVAAVLSAPYVPMHGFSRRGLVAVSLDLGRWAVAAAAEQRAASGAPISLHSYTAVAAVCAAGQFLRGCALEAQWEQQALEDAWRLARDAAAAGLIFSGAFPGCEAADYSDGVSLLLGTEAAQGAADDLQLPHAARPSGTPCSVGPMAGRRVPTLRHA
jgi:hypothetical protein